MIEIVIALAIFLTPREAQVPTAQETYASTWEWCENRFPFRDDLQEACRWGAYEMIPASKTP